MTLNQLKYFCTASRCHSITKAAQVLFVTQPTISIAIRDLEIEFAVTLFHRSGNKLTLTKEGEEIYNKATYIMQYCADMKSECSSELRPKNPIQIGIPPMLSTVFFPELYNAYKAENPDSVLLLKEYGSMRACDLVQNDELDLALVNMELYNIDKFNKYVLFDDRLLFCVAKDHPLAGRTSITTEEMAKEKLIFFNADSVQNQLLKWRFEAVNLHPEVIVQCSQLYTTIQFVKENHCGCFCYSSMVSKFDDLVGIPMDPDITANIGLVWKKGKYVSNEIQKLLDFTKKYYKDYQPVGRYKV